MVCVRLETGPVAGRWGAGMWRVEELGVTVCVVVRVYATEGGL